MSYYEKSFWVGGVLYALQHDAGPGNKKDQDR